MPISTLCMQKWYDINWWRTKRSMNKRTPRAVDFILDARFKYQCMLHFNTITINNFIVSLNWLWLNFNCFVRYWFVPNASTFFSSEYIAVVCVCIWLLSYSFVYFPQNISLFDQQILFRMNLLYIVNWNGRNLSTFLSSFSMHDDDLFIWS